MEKIIIILIAFLLQACYITYEPTIVCNVQDKFLHKKYTVEKQSYEEVFYKSTPTDTFYVVRKLWFNKEPIKVDSSYTYHRKRLKMFRK